MVNSTNGFTQRLLKHVKLRPHPGTTSLTPPTHPLPQLHRYVHTLTKGAPDMANTFAKQHSLCKLAQSLKAYWSTSPASTPEAMVEWEECMSSLLEVASSVALMTGERDVLSVLDIDAYSGITEVSMHIFAPALSCVGYRGKSSLAPCTSVLVFREKIRKSCRSSRKMDVTVVSHLRPPQRPVLQAIGAYLVRRPGVLQQYQDVGGACLRQHLLGTVRA